MFSHEEFEVVDAKKLCSQRNYQRLNPFIIGMIGGTNETSKIVKKFKVELIDMFDQYLNPNLYNEHLEFIYFKIICPFSDKEESIRFKSGMFKSKQRSYFCEVFFDNTFSDKKREIQKEIFADFIYEAIKVSERKLEKKKLDNNKILFDDATKIINQWKRE